MASTPSESCRICGGDGRIANAFGSTATCPGCHGSGHRAEDTGFRDVTKTKPSHFRQPNKGPAAAPKPQWPTTFEGGQIAGEVQACNTVSAETKARLIREIMEHETQHATCTQTFIKKIRKQVRARVG